MRQRKRTGVEQRWLQYQLKSYGYSVGKLSRMFFVSTTTLYDWFGGRYKMPKDVQDKLMKLLAEQEKKANEKKV